MRTLLPLLLLCLLFVTFVVGEPQEIQEVEDAENAEFIEPPKSGESSDAAPLKGKTAEPPRKDSPPSKSQQRQLMGKPAIGKDLISPPSSTSPRGKNPPISSSDKSPADLSEPRREMPPKKDTPAFTPPKGKIDSAVAANDPVSGDATKKADLDLQASNPAGSGPLAGPPLKPGVVPMGPAFDPRAPGPHNGWGYYNEFNYPSRLARPRAFSYNDAQRLMIKASLPFTLASLILAAMYIL